MSGPGRGGCSGPGGCGDWLFLGMGHKRRAAWGVRLDIATRQHDALSKGPTWLLGVSSVSRVPVGETAS